MSFLCVKLRGVEVFSEGAWPSFVFRICYPFICKSITFFDEMHSSSTDDNADSVILHLSGESLFERIVNSSGDPMSANESENSRGMVVSVVLGWLINIGFVCTRCKVQGSC